MNMGDIVKYRGDNKGLTGKIKSIQNERWFKVEWSDRVILLEHVEDLELARVQRDKKRQSK